MSVLKKDQKETDIFFLKLILELCAEAGIMLEKRKKDRFHNVYAPIILNNGLMVYSEAALGNSIMISKANRENDFEQRRLHFQNALGQLDIYENSVRMFIETHIQKGTMNKTKAFKFLQSNGIKIAKIRTSLTRILKKDIDKVNKLRKQEAKELEKERLKQEEITRQKLIAEYCKAQDSFYKERSKEKEKAICPIRFID